MKEQEYILNADGIDEISMDLHKLLTEQGLDRREAIRIRLTIEELLLRVRDFNQEEPVSASLTVRKRFGVRTLYLTYGGPSFNPSESGEEEEVAGSRLLRNLGLNPTWSFRRGENRIQIQISKRRPLGQVASVLLALALAGILGKLGLLLPPETVTSITNVLLTPTFNAFLGLLTTFAGLMIFLTISSGVFGIGDTGSLSRVGKVMFPRFLLGVLAASAATVLLPLPFLSLGSQSGTEGASQAKEISEMLFNILPKSPVNPFLEGNAMQIVVLAVFSGVVLLLLGDQTSLVSRFIEQSCLLVQTMLRIVCKLIPVFVFVSFLRLIWSGTAGVLLGLWKPFCIGLGMDILVTAVLLAMASIRGKASPVTILRKIIPAFVIAVSTASCMAAYPTAITVGEHKLGIQRRLLDFGMPIGVVIYMPCVAVFCATVSLYLAELYQVEVNLSWFILAILICAILAVAVPPIPGAMLTVYGILLAQLGIPSEGLLLAATLDIVSDFTDSGFIILHLSLEMVQEGDALDMLDRDVLRS